MINKVMNVAGLSSTPDFSQLINNGAIILDVRSEEEFEIAHIIGAINIPLDRLPFSLSQLADNNQPIIICCASGMRSGSAKTFLQSIGYTAVYNAGGWTSLQSKL